MSKVEKKLLLANNSIRIDSLKLRIPLHLVTLLNKEINDNFIWINETTGEVNPDKWKEKSKEYNFSDTSKVKFLIEKRHIGLVEKNTKPQEIFVILLNSKILREDYFEGLHFDRLDQIYNDLMSLKVFEIDYDIFMKSDCTDIDLKYDEVMSQESWTDVIQCFMNETKASPIKNKGYDRYATTKKKPYQNGLQFNDRKYATKDRPFFKLYWKGGELLTPTNHENTKQGGSLDFYNEHLRKQYPEETVKQIVRIETTIKNKAHARKLDIENLTLLGLMSLTDRQLENAFRKIIQKYLNVSKTLKHIEPTNNNNMTPTETMLYNSIVHLMQHTDKLPEAIIKTLVQGIDVPSSKSRSKKQLTELYNTRIKGNSVDVSNDKIYSFLRKFGWG